MFKMKPPSLAFRVDETGKIPEGARVMTENEVYNYQMHKVVNYKPRSDMHWILKGNHLIGFGSALLTTGSVLLLRNVFEIPITKQPVLSVIPVFGCSIMLSTILHSSLRHKIILGNSTKSIRWKSGIYNGIVCGPISSLLGVSYCFGLRRTIDGSNYVQILKSVNTRYLLYICLGMSFLQFCAGYYIADQEINCLEKATLFHHENTIENKTTSPPFIK